MVSGTRFQYRLEAGGRGRWGGIFSAPRHYPFTSTYNFLTDITLDERFDDWDFADASIEKRSVALVMMSGGFLVFCFGIVPSVEILVWFVFFWASSFPYILGGNAILTTSGGAVVRLGEEAYSPFWMAIVLTKHSAFL